jgi:hypothetical protein
MARVAADAQARLGVFFRCRARGRGGVVQVVQPKLSEQEAVRLPLT